MKSFEIKIQDVPYTLTTDHAASSYGIPVLVDNNGRALGPNDRVVLPLDHTTLEAFTAVEYAISNYDGYPDYEQRLALVERFVDSRAR